MSDRVVTTGEARDAIQRFKSILEGGLIQQIEDLNKQGQKLSQPEVWDGRLAQQFRSEWAETYKKLQATKASLAELQKQLKDINDNIMRAGGNQ